MQVRGNRFGVRDKMDLVVASLHESRRVRFCGSEHVDSARGKTFILPGNLLEAMHGDRVVARIERETPKGLEGRIVQILERGNETIVGRFEADGSGLGYVVPFDRRVLTDIQIPTGQSSSAEAGEMVLVQITRWPTATRGPVGKVAEVLGNVDEPGVDTRIIIRKFNIPDAHSEEVVEEARRIGNRGQGADIRGRTTSPVTTVTIDGEHARDFDDAITIERCRTANYGVGVAYAEVSHLREGGTCARRGGVHERGHVRCISPSVRGTVSSGACHRALQSQSERRSSGAVCR